MSLPNALVTKTNGNLGGVAPSEDGICAIVGSGVAVSGNFALGDILGPFYSIYDAEAKGITEAYDTTNKSLMWHHISDFYRGAGNGTELYVKVVADSVIMKDMADKTKSHLAPLLVAAGGRVRMAAITRTPPTSYTALVTSGFDDDAVIDAVSKAHELALAEYEANRPIDLWIEGRAYVGTAATAKNLRDTGTSPNANSVSIVISQDTEVSALFTEANKYANVCYAMGVAAGVHVGRNIGRIRSGALPILKPGLSSGSTIETVLTAAPTALDTLHDKGYVFIRNFTGKSGYYFNDDANACVLTDDYATKKRSRVANKATRIVRTVELENLNDDVEVDATTGYLPVATIKAYQREIQRAVEVNMDGEISGVTVFIDPEQNLLSSDTLDVQVDVIPKANIGNVSITLGLKNPANV